MYNGTVLADCTKIQNCIAMYSFMPDWNHIDMPVYCKHAKAYIACIQGCSCSII